MTTYKRQGWIASRCIDCPPLVGLSPISRLHCKFSSKFSGEKMLMWQKQKWAGKAINMGAKVTYNNSNNARVTCKAPNVGESEFVEKVLKSDVPVLVDFVADWCGPCKLVAPFIDWASQVVMALWQKSQQVYLQFKVYHCPTYLRSYKTKAEWKKIRPMILERIKQRARDYPVMSMIPVAHDVLKARAVLIEGVSNLLRVIPVKACRHCSEVYVGHIGHHIRTCRGPKWGAKVLVHEWIEGNIDDILVPVESFHLYNMFQNVIKHDERFDFDRIPAVAELCIQAGVDLPEYPTNRTKQSLNTEYGFPFQFSDHSSENANEVSLNTEDKVLESPFILPEELRALAKRTLQAWERTRLGTKKLMFVYPVKVCQFCPEVHVGPSGHKAQLCGIFKYQSWRGHHMWKSADLDDLIPPRYVWHIRKQDVPPLLDEGRGYYGHAPAVVELCVQAGAAIPNKYHCMMKINCLRSA